MAESITESSVQGAYVNTASVANKSLIEEAQGIIMI